MCLWQNKQCVANISNSQIVTSQPVADQVRLEKAGVVMPLSCLWEEPVMWKLSYLAEALLTLSLTSDYYYDVCPVAPILKWLGCCVLLFYFRLSGWPF